MTCIDIVLRFFCFIPPIELHALKLSFLRSTALRDRESVLVALFAMLEACLLGSPEATSTKIDVLLWDVTDHQITIPR